MSAPFISSQCLAYKVWHTIQAGHMDVSAGKSPKFLRYGISFTNMNNLATDVAARLNKAAGRHDGKKLQLTTPGAVKACLLKLFRDGAVKIVDGRAVAVNSNSKRQRSQAVKYSRRLRTTTNGDRDLGAIQAPVAMNVYPDESPCLELERREQWWDYFSMTEEEFAQLRAEELAIQRMKWEMGEVMFILQSRKVDEPGMVDHEAGGDWIPSVPRDLMDELLESGFSLVTSP